MTDGISRLDVILQVLNYYVGSAVKLCHSSKHVFKGHDSSVNCMDHMKKSFLVNMFYERDSMWAYGLLCEPFLHAKYFTTLVTFDLSSIS